MLKNNIIFVDDEKDFTDIIIAKLSKELPSLKFIAFQTREDFFNHIAEKNNIDGCLFAVIDKNLENDYAGIDISKKLNKNKVHHIILSSEKTSYEDFDVLKKHLYCINFYLKTDMMFVIFQLRKAIDDASQHNIKINSLLKSEVKNIAVGIIMQRMAFSKKEALAFISKASNKVKMKDMEFCERLVMDSEFFASCK